MKSTSTDRVILHYAHDKVHRPQGKQIPETLFTVRLHNHTQLEERQFVTIQHYFEWEKMKDNLLRPRPGKFYV